MPKLQKSKQNKFRPALLTLLRKVGGKLEHLEEAVLLAAGENSADESDEFGSDGYTREQQVSLIENEDEIRKLTEEALKRIQEATFGSCLACDCLIPNKRLQAIPYARYCVSCQELEEQGKLQLD